MDLMIDDESESSLWKEREWKNENTINKKSYWLCVLGYVCSTWSFHFHALEKEIATHSSVLAWRVPGTGEPGGLPSTGSHGVGCDWSDLAVAVRHNGLMQNDRIIKVKQGKTVSTNYSNQWK